jgi:hypothetical protein
MWTSCGQPKSDDLARPLVLSDVMCPRDEQAVIQTALENRSMWMMLREWKLSAGSDTGELG